MKVGLIFRTICSIRQAVVLDEEVAIFSVKDYIVNIIGFPGHNFSVVHILSF